MSVSRYSLAALLMLGAAWPAAQAREDESIVVTATRLPRNAATSASISTLSSEDLTRRQSSYLVDALATLPGVTVAQNGAFGGQATLRLRGAASEQTLVLIDGVTVNDTTSPGGGYNFAFLDPASIERVEVLRGPQSTLWGSDAIGGVVNVITKRPQDGLGVSGFLEGGSFETIRGSASVWGGSGPVDGRLTFVGTDTDGISKADRRDGNPETDPYNSWAIDGRVGVDLSEAVRVEVFGRYTDSQAAFDSFGTATGVRDGNEISDTKESLVGAVGRFTLFDGKFENIIQVSHTEIERRNISSGFESFYAEGARTAFRYQGTVHITDDVMTVFGAEHEESESAGSGTDASIDLNGYFALVEATLFDRLTVSGGVRYDDHSRFGEKTTGSLGASLEVADWLTLKANWGQGFKAPTIYQLTQFFAPARAPNGALQPEEAEGFDIGARVSAFDGKLQIEASYFELDTENLIQFSGGRYINIAQAESSGFEFEAAAELGGGVMLRTSYTYTDARNAITGLRLPRVPRNAGFVELDWQSEQGFGFGAMLRYNGEETDSVRAANPRGIIESWTRLDLTARYAISDEVEIYGRIENVTDEHYQDIFGYGTPGRSGYAGVRVRFE